MAHFEQLVHHHREKMSRNFDSRSEHLIFSSIWSLITPSEDTSEFLSLCQAKRFDLDPLYMRTCFSKQVHILSNRVRTKD